ncbi:MAG: hypothetical protein LBE57_00330 [Methanosarcinales archaeon]|jgi:transposase-like protein|nr:hypothetical protein [Methanosarcinales archaeon]
MAHFIQCPACQTTDLELSAADSNKIHKTHYCCSSCNKDFIVEYKNKPKSFVDRHWKAAAVVVLMLL